MDRPGWETKITDIKKNEIRIYGYSIDDLMTKRSFAETAYLLFTGELPAKQDGKMFNIIMTACADHGVNPPSTLAALTAASTGAPTNVALAAGILSINEFHGGAIENTMKTLLELEGILKLSELKDIKEAALKLVKIYKSKGKKLSGFGHRFHTKDPRTVKLFQSAEELEISEKYVNLLHRLKDALTEVTGRTFPINVDGAVGALLLELGIKPEYGNAVFIMSRMPGLIAHIIEEKNLQKKMRTINPENYTYTGIKARGISD